jgi:DNA-binding HxlR family transcriptional regulator
MDRAAQIAYALSMIGDRWTLLLLCELRLGMQHFEEIRAHTGMSSHLLRNRLRRMEADGVIERRQYHARPPRYAYVATAKGRDLDMVLLALHRWGCRWSGMPGAAARIGPGAQLLAELERYAERCRQCNTN